MVERSEGRGERARPRAGLGGLARGWLPRARAPAVYAALCGLALLAARERTWQHLTVLNGEEWQPIQDIVRPAMAPGEALCFLPRWTSGHATDQNKFRGIDLVASPEEAWRGRDEPLAGLWVVSQFGAFDPGRVPEELYPHRAGRRLGQAEIWAFRTRPFELPDSLVFHLHEGRCALHGPGSRRLEMVWRRTGHVMPRALAAAERPDYLGCRASREQFGGRPQVGIWLHPPPSGQAVSLTFPEARLGPWLAVSGGLTDHAATPAGAPVRLQVILDGRTLQSLTFPSQRGWRTFGVATGRTGGTGRLSFKVTTERNHARHFLFDAEPAASRPASPPEAGRGPSRPAPGGREGRVGLRRELRVGGRAGAER